MALKIAKSSWDLLTRHKTPREWYNSDTGEGYGHDPFWGFSGLAAFMPLEIELGNDPTSLDTPDLRKKMDAIRGQADTLDEDTG